MTTPLENIKLLKDAKWVPIEEKPAHKRKVVKLKVVLGHWSKEYKVYSRTLHTNEKSELEAKLEEMIRQFRKTNDWSYYRDRSIEYYVTTGEVSDKKRTNRGGPYKVPAYARWRRIPNEWLEERGLNAGLTQQEIIERDFANFRRMLR